MHIISRCYTTNLVFFTFVMQTTFNKTVVAPYSLVPKVVILLDLAPSKMRLEPELVGLLRLVNYLDDAKVVVVNDSRRSTSTPRPSL